MHVGMGREKIRRSQRIIKRRGELFLENSQNKVSPGIMRYWLLDRGLCMDVRGLKTIAYNTLLRKGRVAVGQTVLSVKEAEIFVIPMLLMRFIISQVYDYFETNSDRIDTPSYQPFGSGMMFLNGNVFYTADEKTVDMDVILQWFTINIVGFPTNISGTKTGIKRVITRAPVIAILAWFLHIYTILHPTFVSLDTEIVPDKSPPKSPPKSPVSYPDSWTMFKDVDDRYSLPYKSPSKSPVSDEDPPDFWNLSGSTLPYEPHPMMCKCDSCTLFGPPPSLDETDDFWPWY